MNDLTERAKTFYRVLLSDPETACREYVDPGFVLENHLPGHIPFGGRYEGHQGLMRYLGELVSAIEMGPLEFAEWVADDHAVVVHGQEGSLVLSTNRRYRMRFVHWLTFNDDGLVTSMREFNDTAEMAEAFDRD